MSLPVPKTGFIEYSAGGKVVGRVNINLFKNTPITSANFGALLQGFDLPAPISNAAGTRQLTHVGYKNTLSHRVIKGFMIQNGDVTEGALVDGQLAPRARPGIGGVSAYGRKFNDENFINKHKIGALSMANSGKNTNGSQFFLCTCPCDWLDGAHVVFGEVQSKEDYAVADAVQKYSKNQQGETTVPIVISDCGVTEWYTEEELKN